MTPHRHTFSFESLSTVLEVKLGSVAYSLGLLQCTYEARKYFARLRRRGSQETALRCIVGMRRSCLQMMPHILFDEVSQVGAYDRKDLGAEGTQFLPSLTPQNLLHWRIENLVKFPVGKLSLCHYREKD